MKANLAANAEQVIDARGPLKFDGTQEDVFPFKKLGHIPNAVNTSVRRTKLSKRKLSKTNKIRVLDNSN